MKIRILFILLLVNFLIANDDYQKRIIEPVKSKKALIYLPFQSDFKKDYRSLIEELYKQYDLTVLSSRDIIININGNTKKFNKINFNLSIFTQYFQHLNEYDFIFIDTHSSKSSIAVGIPYVKNENNIDYSKYGLSPLFNIETKMLGFDEVKFRGERTKGSYAVGKDFFQRFRGDKKFKNTIFVNVSCHSAENTTYGFQDYLTNTDYPFGGCSIYTGWSGTTGEKQTIEVEIPFIKNLVKGQSIDEAMKDIETKHQKSFFSKDIFEFFGLTKMPDSDFNFFKITKAPDIPTDYDIALYDKRDRLFLVGDEELLFSDTELVDDIPNQNIDLIFNMINSVKGEPAKSNKIKIYSGHGGRYLNNSSSFATKLATNGSDFEINYRDEESLVLNGYRSVIIMNPGYENDNFFSATEVNRILDFIKQGGSVILVFDKKVGDSPNPNTYNDLLKKLGIEVECVTNHNEISSFKNVFSSQTRPFFPTNISLSTFNVFTILNNSNDKNHALVNMKNGDENIPVVIESFVDTTHIEEPEEPEEPVIDNFHRTVFNDDFNTVENLENKWKIENRHGCCGFETPAQYSKNNNKLQLIINGTGRGVMGIYDGSQFLPKDITLTNDFYIETWVKEISREKNDNKDNSGIGISIEKIGEEIGIAHIGIRGNYSGYFDGYNYNEYEGHRIQGTNVLHELSLTSLYELGFRIYRKGNIFTVGYKLKNDNSWTDTSTTIDNIGDVRAMLSIGSGDGGSTSQNGDFSAEVDYFKIMQ